MLSPMGLDRLVGSINGLIQSRIDVARLKSELRSYWECATPEQRAAALLRSKAQIPIPEDYEDPVKLTDQIMTGNYMCYGPVMGGYGNEPITTRERRGE